MSEQRETYPTRIPAEGEKVTVEHIDDGRGNERARAGRIEDALVNTLLGRDPRGRGAQEHRLGDSFEAAGFDEEPQRAEVAIGPRDEPPDEVTPLGPQPPIPEVDSARSDRVEGPTRSDH